MATGHVVCCVMVAGEAHVCITNLRHEALRDGCRSRTFVLANAGFDTSLKRIVISISFQLCLRDTKLDTVSVRVHKDAEW